MLRIHHDIVNGTAVQQHLPRRQIGLCKSIRLNDHSASSGFDGQRHLKLIGRERIPHGGDAAVPVRKTRAKNANLGPDNGIEKIVPILKGDHGIQTQARLKGSLIQSAPLDPGIHKSTQANMCQYAGFSAGCGMEQVRNDPKREGKGLHPIFGNHTSKTGRHPHMRGNDAAEKARNRKQIHAVIQVCKITGKNTAKNREL